MNTGEQVKAYRLKHAWSQEQLAEMTALSVRTIQRIEKGHQPGLETLSALAAVFQVNVAELSGDIEQANDTLDQRIHQTRFRVEQEAHLIRKTITAFLVCTILVIINYLFSPGSYWSALVIVLWGALLAIRALKTLVLQQRMETWQQQRMQKLLREKNNSKECPPEQPDSQKSERHDKTEK